MLIANVSLLQTNMLFHKQKTNKYKDYRFGSKLVVMSHNLCGCVKLKSEFSSLDEIKRIFRYYFIGTRDKRRNFMIQEFFPGIFSIF